MWCLDVQVRLRMICFFQSFGGSFSAVSQPVGESPTAEKLLLSPSAVPPSVTFDGRCEPRVFLQCMYRSCARLPADAHGNNNWLPPRFQDFSQGRTLLGNSNPERDHDNEDSTDQRRKVLHIWKEKEILN